MLIHKVGYHGVHHSDTTEKVEDRLDNQVKPMQLRNFYNTLKNILNYLKHFIYNS